MKNSLLFLRRRLANLLKSSLVLASAALLLSCNTANIVVPDEFAANASVYEVSGNNIQIRQRIRYGGYTTSLVDRSLTTYSSTSVSVLSNTKAQQKLSFNQFTPDGQRAEIFAQNIYRSKQFDILTGGIKKFAANYRDAYVGTVKPASGGEVWEFAVRNLDDRSESADTDYGKAESDTGDVIYINGVNKLQNDPLPGEHTTTFGFMFRHKGRTIGAVSVKNNGKVWLRNDLTAEEKLVVSSLATALILRRTVKKS